MLKRGLIIALVVFAALCSRVARADNLTLVVGLPPGSATDLIARAIQKSAPVMLDRTVVVENKVGANSKVAATSVKDARPDGSVLWVATSTPVSGAPYLFKEVGYDPVKDFKPVALVGKQTFALVVKNGEFRTLPEFIAYAKRGYLRFGYGSGITQVLARQFTRLAGINATEVPELKGGDPQVAIDLLSDGIDYAVISTVPAQTLVESGKFTVLAICTDAQSILMPLVPLMRNAGVPDYVPLESWTGILAPSGMSQELADKYSQKFAEALASDDLQKSLKKLDFAVRYAPPNELRRFMESQSKAWSVLAPTNDVLPQ